MAQGLMGLTLETVDVAFDVLQNVENGNARSSYEGLGLLWICFKTLERDTPPRVMEV